MQLIIELLGGMVLAYLIALGIDRVVQYVMDNNKRK